MWISLSLIIQRAQVTDILCQVIGWNGYWTSVCVFTYFVISRKLTQIYTYLD